MEKKCIDAITACVFLLSTAAPANIYIYIIAHKTQNKPNYMCCILCIDSSTRTEKLRLHLSYSALSTPNICPVLESNYNFRYSSKTVIFLSNMDFRRALNAFSCPLRRKHSSSLLSTSLLPLIP